MPYVAFFLLLVALAVSFNAYAWQRDWQTFNRLDNHLAATLIALSQLATKALMQLAYFI